MQKHLSHDTQVFSASSQIINDEALILETHLKANKLRAKAFAEFSNAFANGVVALFVGVAKWFSSKAQKSRVMSQLYSMDDRALADIGLTRGDIEGVLNGTWIREPLQPLQPIAKNLQFVQNTQASKTVAVQDATRIAA